MRCSDHNDDRALRDRRDRQEKVRGPPAAAAAAAPSSADCIAAACPGTLRGKARETCLRTAKLTCASAVTGDQAPPSIQAAYSGFTGPMPTVPWGAYEQTLISGAILKTMPATGDFSACKASCHRDKRCTHFEVTRGSSGKKTCVLKSIGLPNECSRMEQRCSDGWSTKVDTLFAHPDRYVETSAFARNLYAAMKQKFSPKCNWKCKLAKAFEILTWVSMALTVFIPGAGIVLGAAISTTLKAAMTVADISIQAISVGLENGVVEKENKKREETMARGEPYDTAILKGIPYRHNAYKCPAQDASCNDVVTMVEAKLYMDETKKIPADWKNRLSASDRAKFNATLKVNQEFMRQYQKLPCKLNCADKSVEFKDETFAYV